MERVAKSFLQFWVPATHSESRYPHTVKTWNSEEASQDWMVFTVCQKVLKWP